MATRKEDSLRNSYLLVLLRGWMKEKRPDVFEACRDEAVKKYPYSERRGLSKGMKLPASLEKMK